MLYVHERALAPSLSLPRLLPKAEATVCSNTVDFLGLFPALSALPRVHWPPPAPPCMAYQSFKTDNSNVIPTVSPESTNPLTPLHPSRNDHSPANSDFPRCFALFSVYFSLFSVVECKLFEGRGHLSFFMCFSSIMLSMLSLFNQPTGSQSHMLKNVTCCNPNITFTDAQGRHQPCCPPEKAPIPPNILLFYAPHDIIPFGFV